MRAVTGCFFVTSHISLGWGCSSTLYRGSCVPHAKRCAVEDMETARAPMKVQRSRVRQSMQTMLGLVAAMVNAVAHELRKVLVEEARNDVEA